MPKVSIDAGELQNGPPPPFNRFDLKKRLRDAGFDLRREFWAWHEPADGSVYAWQGTKAEYEHRRQDESEAAE